MDANLKSYILGLSNPSMLTCAGFHSLSLPLLSNLTYVETHIYCHKDLQNRQNSNSD